MRFLLELPDDNREVTIEIHALREAISNDMRAEYKMTLPTYFDRLGPLALLPKDLQRTLKQSVPVGDIPFVQSYLRNIHGINEMNPIEIPKNLRIPKMLMRNYSFVKYEDLPREGIWFIKDVSVLKNGSYCGDIKELFKDNASMKLNPEHIYQVSSTIDIVSEYRVFVHRNIIKGIQYYDGNVCVMPNEAEIKKIQEAVLRYSTQKDCPDAYTMDWAVINTKAEIKRDIALLEVHPFVSVGTYGLEGPILIDMYKDGFKWYLQHNTPITVV